MSGRPQDLIEQALGAATLPCVGWVTERTEANLRWANNGLITNGEMRSRRLTVNAIAGVEGGTASGTVSQEVAGAEEVGAVVAAAERLARTGRPAEDATPLVENYANDDRGSSRRRRRASRCLINWRRGWAMPLSEPRQRSSCCSASPNMLWRPRIWAAARGCGAGACSRLAGSSSTRKQLIVQLRPGWAYDSRFPDVDVAEAAEELNTRLGWARTKVDLPAGRYETLLPPGAIADLMIYVYWTANARDAEEGRNVYAAGDGATKIGRAADKAPDHSAIRSPVSGAGNHTVRRLHLLTR